jgi:hypothetical protein
MHPENKLDGIAIMIQAPTQPYAGQRTQELTQALTERPHPLNTLFAPKTVAVIGATENPGSVGRTILWNLISSPFGGHGVSGQSEAA